MKWGKTRVWQILANYNCGESEDKSWESKQFSLLSESTQFLWDRIFSFVENTWFLKQEPNQTSRQFMTGFRNSSQSAQCWWFGYFWKGLACKKIKDFPPLLGVRLWSAKKYTRSFPFSYLTLHCAPCQKQLLCPDKNAIVTVFSLD